MIKGLRVVAIFLIVWQGIPRLVGVGLREFNFYYDPIVANEVTILMGSILFMLFLRRPDYGLNFRTKDLPRIALLTFALQSFSIAGVIILFALKIKVPNFPYGDSIIEMLLKYVVLTPLCEEVFMRGLIQTNIEIPGGITFRSVTVSTPVLVSSTLFGIMHTLPFHHTVNPIRDFLWTFLMSLIAGYYRAKTGSLFSAFATHSLYNFWGGIPARLLYVFS
ncbi:MAG TPA: type II CAAX endopeptidase family protein [Cyclobacteriaceae bacterium]|nr:type II CAAX endopeptidase family protein [Cyclobacteriaceae bacterium]